MTAVFTKIRQVVWPDTEPRHGPLRSLLIVMTFVTGLVDAFSYLVLGHVFVANMTGNVVFLGFALAGAPGFSIAASCTALAVFVVGAFVGGWLGHRFSTSRVRLLSTATALQAVLVAAAVVLAAVNDGHVVAGGARFGLIVVLAAAMGLQN